MRVDRCVSCFDRPCNYVKTKFSEDMSIPDTPSEKAMDVIQKEFPHGPDKGSIRVIFGAEDGEKLTAESAKKQSKIRSRKSIKMIPLTRLQVLLLQEQSRKIAQLPMLISSLNLQQMI